MEVAEPVYHLVVDVAYASGGIEPSGFHLSARMQFLTQMAYKTKFTVS